MKSEKTSFLLGKSNIAVLVAGFLVVIFGFILMSGGKIENPDDWNEEKFNDRRLTYAPITVIVGFTIVGFGIMMKPKRTLGESMSSNEIDTTS